MRIERDKTLPILGGSSFFTGDEGHTSSFGDEETVQLSDREGGSEGSERDGSSEQGSSSVAADIGRSVWVATTGSKAGCSWVVGECLRGDDGGDSAGR